jgi:hypothetical protein
MFTSPLTELIAQAIGWLYVACNILWTVLTMCLRVPLTLQKDENSDDNIWKAILDVCRDFEIAWRLVLIFCCFVALTGKHYWLFAFLLLDFLVQNKVLLTILSALTTTLKSLLMTFLGVLIVTFVYAAMVMSSLLMTSTAIVVTAS